MTQESSERFFYAYQSSAEVFDYIASRKMVTPLVLSIPSRNSRLQLILYAGCKGANSAKNNPRRLDMVIKTNMHMVRNAARLDQYANMVFRTWAEDCLASQGIRGREDEGEITSLEFIDLTKSYLGEKKLFEAKISLLFAALAQESLENDLGTEEIDKILDFNEDSQVTEYLKSIVVKKETEPEQSDLDTKTE